MIQQRIEYIDVLKGFGILFVVIAHLYSNSIVKNFLYSFHIPLFFFISGILMNINKYNNLRDILKRKFISLYFPFIIFYIILWLYWYLIERDYRSMYIHVSALDTLFGLVWGSDTYHWIYPVGPLWFVPALFSMEIIMYKIVKLKQIYNIVICLILIFTLGIALSRYDLFILPWGLNNALISIPFFYVGFLCNKLNIENVGCNINKKWFLVLAIILFVFDSIYCYVYGCEIDISRLKMGNVLIFLLLPFVGIFTWLYVSKVIENNKLMQWLGKNSLVILAFHAPIARALTFVFSVFFHLDKIIILSNFISAFVIILITLLMCYPICCLWNYIWPKIDKSLTVWLLNDKVSKC